VISLLLEHKPTPQRLPFEKIAVLLPVGHLLHGWDIGRIIPWSQGPGYPWDQGLGTSTQVFCR
jgi:hypothetical protein